MTTREKQQSYYPFHVFFCTNQKQDGRKCCAQGGAEAMWLYAKLQLKEKGMLGKGLGRVSRSGCMGRCAVGPAVVIYPEGVWYTYQTKEDIDRIIEQHLCQGNWVEDLLLSN